MCIIEKKETEGEGENGERRGPFSWTGMNEMLLNIHFYSPPTVGCVATGCKPRPVPIDAFSFHNTADTGGKLQST